MNRRSFISSLSFLVLGRFIHANNNSLEARAEQHYAVEVLFDSDPGTNLVANPKYALGAPDGKYAEILEKGTLVIKMQKPFYATRGANNGVIIAKPGSQYSVAMNTATEEDEKKGIQYVWRRVPPTTSNIEGGLQIQADVQVDTILIKNTGKKRVEIDAVIAGYA